MANLSEQVLQQVLLLINRIWGVHWEVGMKGSLAILKTVTAFHWLENLNIVNQTSQGKYNQGVDRKWEGRGHVCWGLRKTFLKRIVIEMYLYEKRGFYQVEMEKEGILSLHLYIQTHTHTQILSCPFIHLTQMIIQILILCHTTKENYRGFFVCLFFKSKKRKRKRKRRRRNW